LRQQQVVPVCSHANCIYEIEESKTGWKVTVNSPLGSPWWNLLLPREMYFQAIEQLQRLLSIPGIEEATVIVRMMNESDPWGDLQLVASLTREEAQCVQLKTKPVKELCRALVRKWYIGLRGEDVPKPMSEEVKGEILRRAARDTVLITDIQRGEQGWSIEALLVDNSSAWRPALAEAKARLLAQRMYLTGQVSELTITITHPDGRFRQRFTAEDLDSVFD
jgi:hypothetical protein